MDTQSWNTGTYVYFCKELPYFLTMSALIFIPVSSVQGFPCLHFLNRHLLPFILLITAGLIGVKQYLVMVLICLPLMVSDAEHAFMYLLAICICHLEKYLFKPITCFNWIIWIFAVEFFEFLILSSYQLLVRYITFKYFLPFYRLSIKLTFFYLEIL